MFTPGPWINDNGLVKGKNGNILFEYITGSDKERDADLIAAAPEMYEALKAMLEQLEGPACVTTLDAHGNDVWPEINAVASHFRYLIAKIDGK